AQVAALGQDGGDLERPAAARRAPERGGEARQRERRGERAHDATAPLGVAAASRLATPGATASSASAAATASSTSMRRMQIGSVQRDVLAFWLVRQGLQGGAW